MNVSKESDLVKEIPHYKDLSPNQFNLVTGSLSPDLITVMLCIPTDGSLKSYIFEEALLEDVIHIRKQEHGVDISREDVKFCILVLEAANMITVERDSMRLTFKVTRKVR